MVWSSVEWEEGWVGKMGWGLFATHSKCISDMWLDVEQETTTSNYWIDCNFKSFRGHASVTTTKWPISWLPHPLHLQKWTIGLLFKNKRICRHVTNFKNPPPCGHPLSYGRHKSVVPYVLAVIWFFFSGLEKISILLFECNKPIIKILLKDISKP